jgi:environmental stress-induced protein Ves
MDAVTSARDDAGDEAGLVAGTLRVRRFGDHREMPWRNGGGTTREIAIGPAGASPTDFDWRISIADVTAGGPFSAYPGVDRVIMLVAGTSMLLRVDDAQHALGPLEPFAFAGESRTTCEVPGPSRDLNVMTRRADATATVEVLHPGEGRQVDGAAPLVLVAVSGSVRVVGPDGAAVTLDPLDAALWADARPLTLAGTGAAAVVRIRA